MPRCRLHQGLRTNTRFATAWVINYVTAEFPPTTLYARAVMSVFDPTRHSVKQFAADGSAPIASHKSAGELRSRSRGPTGNGTSTVAERLLIFHSLKGLPTREFPRCVTTAFKP
jgi:hypothetical protein